MTDRTLPSSILKSGEFTDSKFYEQLSEMEKKLDWTMLRKKVEIQDSMGKPAQVRLRRTSFSELIRTYNVYRQLGHYVSSSVIPCRTKHGKQTVALQEKAQTLKAAKEFLHGH